MRRIEIPYVAPSLELDSRIVIVGSSGNLRGSNLGAEIDSYSDVIRFNRAPTDGFGESVGSRTTLRVSNNHVFSNVDITAEGYTNQPANFMKDLRNERILYIAPDTNPWNNRGTNTHSSNELFLFNYGAVPHLKSELGLDSEKQLTVGAITVGLCALAGIVPTLAGFDLQPAPRTHYWENRPENPGATHGISVEQAWLCRLKNDGKIIILGE